MFCFTVFIMGGIFWTVQVEIAKFRDRRYIISPADLTMVRVKGPEILYDFSPFRLAERKGSCRLSTAVKRQMGRSGVMACSSVTYESMKFYETGQTTEPF